MDAEDIAAHTERAKDGKDRDVAFLEAAADYFEKRPTNGEDMEHWANVYNSTNCRRIAKRLQTLLRP